MSEPLKADQLYRPSFKNVEFTYKKRAFYDIKTKFYKTREGKKNLFIRLNPLANVQLRVLTFLKKTKIYYLLASWTIPQLKQHSSSFGMYMPL